MSKEQMMQEFVSSAITPLLERVVVKKLIQSFDVIAEQQKAELSAAKARIAELEKALKSVMPYVITDTVECRGDKCRELWCMSCGTEDDANAAVADALAAVRRAAELLEGE